MPVSQFQIRRSNPDTKSGLLPNVAVPRGTALKYLSKDPATGENTLTLADGLANGFVTRDIQQSAGLTDANLVDQLMGLTPITATGDVETPFEATKPGSIETVIEYEAEGSDFVLSSGTGAITAATAAGTKLSFRQGKTYVAQTGDFAQYRLVAQMTPLDSGNPCRIFCAAVTGYLVP